MWIVVAAVVIVLIAIVLLSGSTVLKKKTRGEFLQELAKFLEGALESIPERNNSFQINFSFEGEAFIIEDIEERGFKDKTGRFFLKSKTPGSFTLSFTEQEKKATKGFMVMASDIPDEPIPEESKINVPRSLKAFHISSNSKAMANEFLSDSQVERVFNSFRNEDERGYQFVSLKIIDGIVILEFYPMLNTSPSLLKLYGNVPSIENYLEQLLPVVRKVKSLAK